MFDHMISVSTRNCENAILTTGSLNNYLANDVYLIAARVEDQLRLFHQKMQVYNPNNIKIYNLSGGKSLPEWLSDRQKRTRLKKDVELRKRISLMQDFEMPLVSGCIEVSRDGQYILATGAYKPRVRCYDVSQMSMKFERCFDSEVVKMKILSEDYSKMAFLQCDRFVEFHAQHGKYYKIRIPKYGRDFDYHSASSDLYFPSVFLVPSCSGL